MKRLGAVTIAAVGLFVAFLVLPPPYSTRAQFDLNSRRERVAHYLFEQPVFTTKSSSRFGAFAEAHLEPLGPAKWRSYHYSSPFDRTRVNYGSAGLHFSLLQLWDAFELCQLQEPKMPLSEQIRLARAAMQLVAAEREFLIELKSVDSTGDWRIEIWDAESLIAEWHP